MIVAKHPSGLLQPALQGMRPHRRACNSCRNHHCPKREARLRSPRRMQQTMTVKSDEADSALPRPLTTDAAVAVFGCSLETLRRRIEAGDLPVIRDGPLVRVHPQDLSRYIAARRSL